MDWLNYVILLSYLSIMIGIAIYSKKKVSSVSDFLFAGKSGVNGWMSAFAYGTTYFSAVIFIGYAGKFGWSFGLASLWIGLGNAIFGSLFAWIVLAKRTKNMTQRLQAHTMPDFFDKRYESQKMKVVSAIIIFTFLIPYSASVYNGLGNLFGIVFGIEGWIVIIVLSGITAFYCFLGGYKATTITDFIQGLIMLVGVITMLIFFFATPEVSWGEGIKQLINNDLGFINSANPNKAWIYDRPASLISLVLLTSFGVWALPQTIHKYYAVRDKKAIFQGTIVSTFFSLIVGIGAYLVGSFATLFYENLNQVGGNTDNLIPNMLDKVMPNGLKGLIAILVLAASMSTLASVSLASSSVVSIDLYKGVIKKNASDKKITLLMRVLCLVFIVASALIAFINSKFNITAIAYLMGLSWGVLAGCFIGPYVLGVCWKKVTRAGAWTSIIGTLILTAVLVVIFGFDNLGWDNVTLGKALKAGMGCSPMIGVICMIYSLVSTFVVSLFTSKPKKQSIYNAFEKEIENLIV